MPINKIFQVYVCEKESAREKEKEREWVKEIIQERVCEVNLPCLCARVP